MTLKLKLLENNLLKMDAEANKNKEEHPLILLEVDLILERRQRTGKKPAWG